MQLVWFGVVVSAFFWNSIEAGVEGPMAASALDRLRKNSPTHTASVDEESSGYDRQFDRKLTQVCPPQHPLS